MGLEVKRLRPETVALLQGQSWPGNVRQLQNLCRQLCVMAPGDQVFPEDLPPELMRDGEPGDEQDWRDLLRRWAEAALLRDQPDLMSVARNELETVLLDLALEHTGGKRVEAARLLGLGRNTLTRKLKERELDE
jgi:two-component system nitrogen regulation response regulator GlnG